MKSKLLEKLELIYVYHHKVRYSEEEQGFKRLNNNYGRFKDKEYIDQYAYNIDEIHGGKTERLEKHNKKRSLKQKYNCMRNGKEYSLEDVKEIYDYIHAKNCETQELIIKTTDEELIARYNDQLLSEEMFKKYDFYEENLLDDIGWIDDESEKKSAGNTVISVDNVCEATDGIDDNKDDNNWVTNHEHMLCEDLSDYGRKYFDDESFWSAVELGARRESA